MPRIGIEFREKQIKINNQQVKLQIWDTAGQERYHKVLGSTFFRRANGIVLVYDVQNQESINQLENWMHQIRQKADPEIEIVLVGNKLDPYAEVNLTSGQDLASRFGIRFFTVSSKTGEGVASIFEVITELILTKNPNILNQASSSITIKNHPDSDSTNPRYCN